MKIVFTPDWFVGHDVLIEAFSFIVLFLFFVLSFRSYKLSKNKNSLYLGIGFLIIALAEVSTILTKIVLYYDTIFTHNLGQIIVTYQVVKSVDIFYYIGFFFHKLFTLLGFYIIYRLPIKKRSGGDLLLAFYFIIVSALFGNMLYYLFHITALILLVLIIDKYYKIYKENNSRRTKVLVGAISLLALSQIMFILSKMSIFYVAAQLIQLVSYLMLLLLIILILKYGKKKKQDRYNFRHVGNNARKRRKN